MGTSPEGLAGASRTLATDMTVAGELAETGMGDQGVRIDEEGGITRRASLRICDPKLVIGAITFVLLTAGAFWFQFHQIQVSDDRPRWDQLRWGYLALILLCLPVESCVCALRMWVISRVLEPGLKLWTCLKADWANTAIAMLTPSQTGGGLGQIYILHRGGGSVGTALTISLLSFVGTMIGLLCMGLYSLLTTGLGSTGRLFMAAAWAILAIGAAMFVGAIWPGLLRTILASISRTVWRFRGGKRPLVDWWPPGQERSGSPVDRMGPLTGRLADTIYTYRDDMARFLRHGKVAFVLVCLLSLGFLLERAFVPFLCVRFLGIEASSLRLIVEAQMALIFVVFFAPTPGAAGVAESVSWSIMGATVPVGFAPYYTLLWRFSTAYVGTIAGLLCLAHAMTLDARRLILHRR